jgi:hypothetical protein
MERDMTEPQPFLQRVAAAQDELLARASAVPREAARWTEGAPSTRARWTFPLVLAVGLGAAAVAFYLRTGLDRAEAPLSFALADAPTAPLATDAPLVAGASAPLALGFSDGSTMKLDPAARARVTRIGAHGAGIRVERGRAVISVVPRVGNDWGVDVGPFHVAVKGTVFSLAWDPETERFDFSLEKGHVVISGACLPKERGLVAGESLHASCRPEPAVAPIEDLPPVEAPAPAVAAPRAHHDTPRAVPSWRALASAQRYADALAAAERAGFEDELRRRDARDLVVLGDAGRLAGSPDRALQAYAAARAKHDAGDRSAFSMGLVEFEQRRRYAAAAGWFATYLREQPRGPLAEQAEGRLMEAWQRAGDAPRARAAAQAYLARSPSGTYADLARRLAPR